MAINQKASQVMYLDRAVTLLTEPPTFSEACMAHGQRSTAIVLAETDMSAWERYPDWAAQQELKRAVFSPEQQHWAQEWALDHR